MRTVAILAPDFTPSSLPPAQRIRLFATHLLEFGWKPIVIATDPQFYEHLSDSENERLLPDSLEVIRTNAFPARLSRKVGFSDIGMRSLWSQWRALTELCQRRRPDVVFISVPPNVSMVLGRLAHMRFGLPYVLDYQDPWITEYYWSLPRAQRPPKWALAYALARVLEPFAIRRVSHIVAVSKGTTNSVLARYPDLAQIRTAEIPFGMETTEINYLKKYPRRQRIFNPSDGLLHVSYVGAFIRPMFDTARAIFQAVRLGLDRNPALFRKLRLHFVGTTYAAHTGRASQTSYLVREAGLEEFVDEHPARLSYLEALQVLTDSHAILVIGSDAPHYTASKIFPCILACRPILAVLHAESTAGVVLRDSEAARLVSFDNQHPPVRQVEKIAEYLEEILSLPGNLTVPVSRALLDRYSARAMTARLAEVFDHVYASQRETRTAAYA